MSKGLESTEGRNWQQLTSKGQEELRKIPRPALTDMEVNPRPNSKLALLTIPDLLNQLAAVNANKQPSVLNTIRAKIDEDTSFDELKHITRVVSALSEHGTTKKVRQFAALTEADASALLRDKLAELAKENGLDGEKGALTRGKY